MKGKVVLSVAALGVWAVLAGAAPEEGREEKLERLMKDMRLVYKSLKEAVKKMEWVRMGTDTGKFLELSDRVPSLAPEDDPGPYRDETKKFTEALRSLETSIHERSPDDAGKAFGRVTDVCKSCHRHYRNPFARMMDNIFLF